MTGPWGPPANAKVYIDFITQRAWTEAANAEVAINTLIGNDTVNTANGTGTTLYPAAARFTAQGLKGYNKDDGGVGPEKPFALLGTAKTLMLAGGTIVIKFAASGIGWAASLAMVDTPGNEALYLDGILDDAQNRFAMGTWNGSLSVNDDGFLATDATNAYAATMGPTIGAVSLNGRTAKSATLISADWPPYHGFVVDNGYSLRGGSNTYLKSLTIYPPQSAAALPGLSAPDVTGSQTMAPCLNVSFIVADMPAAPTAPGGPSRAAQRRLKQAIETRARFEAERARRLANLTNDRPLFVTPPETLQVINETLVEEIDHSVLFADEDQDEELLLLLMMV
jgi:hypothetical protein